jgi:hypothetical protein
VATVAFLLSTDHRPDGTTRIEYDDGPTRRIQLLTLTEQAHAIVDMPGDELLGYTLSDQRAPADRRRQR